MTYFSGANYNGTTLNALTNTNTLGTAVGAATAVYTDFFLDGVIVVGTAGTLTVTAAQNVSTAVGTTVAAGSYFEIDRVA